MTFIITTKQKSKYVVFAKNKREARAKFKKQYDLVVATVELQTRWTKHQITVILATISQLEKFYRTIPHPYRMYTLSQRIRRLNAALRADVLIKTF